MDVAITTVQTTSSRSESPRQRGGRAYWKWIAVAVVLIGLSTAAAFLPVKEWVKAFSEWARTLGAPGVAIFIAVYVLATVLCLPGWIFTIAAGLVYGVAGGFAVAWLSATLGCTASFLCARYLIRERVERALKRNRRFAAVDAAIGEQGWKIVGLLRLSPIIPFNLSNYFYGVTAVGLWPYVFATAIGMLPGTFLYVYLGAAGRAGVDDEGGGSPWKWGLLAVGLLATVAVTVIVNRSANKALEKSGAATSD